jgi:hypothetical protein
MALGASLSTPASRHQLPLVLPFLLLLLLLLFLTTGLPSKYGSWGLVEFNGFCQHTRPVALQLLLVLLLLL